MRPSLRFLGIALTGWVGLRAAMLGAIPGADFYTITHDVAATPDEEAEDGADDVPEIVAIPPADPEAAAMMQAAMPQPLATTFEEAPAPAYYPTYYRVAAAPAPYPQRRPTYRRSLPIVQASMPLSYAVYPGAPYYPSSEDYPLSRMAAAAYPPLGAAPTMPSRSTPVVVATQHEFDRVQLTAWAMLRGREGLRSSPASLASAGTLGASQAGARLAYNFTRQIAASLRTTTTVGKRGGEIALGARVQPVRGLPFWATVERRVALGKYGDGRNAFAAFVEGGLWNKPLPMKFRLNAYLQAGMVGVKTRDGFVDGAVTATRPVYRNYSAGLGIWGAAQPGVARLDAGPRVTMKVRDNVNLHLDYRYKLAGNAQPGSGPVLTLAGDF